MARTQIRGTQILDKTIEPIDLSVDYALANNVSYQFLPVLKHDSFIAKVPPPQFLAIFTRSQTYTQLVIYLGLLPVVTRAGSTVQVQLS
jgi:hypothetical protein